MRITLDLPIQTQTDEKDNDGVPCYKEDGSIITFISDNCDVIGISGPNFHVYLDHDQLKQAIDTIHQVNC